MRDLLMFEREAEERRRVVHADIRRALMRSNAKTVLETVSENKMLPAPEGGA